MIIQSCIGYIKCLSIEAGTSRGGEGSWGKNRNQTQTLKGSEGAGSEARNTARSQILLQSIMKYCQFSEIPTSCAAAEYYATAVSETTPYWVTQNLPLCYTKHHAEQD